MLLSLSRITALSIAAMFLWCGSSHGIDPNKGEEKPVPNPLSQKLTDDWKAAGAKLTWRKDDDTGYLFRMEDAPTIEGYVPCFEIKKWSDGMLDKLPVPETPFALIITDFRAVNDATLNQIKGFKHLVCLELRSRELTDEGLKALAGFADLKVLNITCDSITDAGLKELCSFKKLTKLSFESRAITDMGLTHLATLDSLTSLTLTGCVKLTSDCLKDVAKLDKLQCLNLWRCGFTNDGLKPLKSLKKLKQLGVSNPTKEIKEFFKKELPDCELVG